MVLGTGSGERDLLAAFSPRSLIFGASAALFAAPPPQAPPVRPVISVVAQVPPAGSATFGNAARIALGFPPLDVALPRKPIVVDAATPPLGVGLVSHQSSALFPALAAPALRGTRLTPNWTPDQLPSVVFGATEHTKNQLVAKTIVARPEFRPQEPVSLHFAMPVQFMPPLQPPRARTINVPQQLPQFVTSQVFWRSGAMPTSFVATPAQTTSLGFAMSAASGYPAAAGDFPLYLQWQEEGVNLGLPDVRVVNVTGDPAVIKATRGVGENSNIITLTLNPTAVVVVPGWNTTNESGNWPFTNADFTAEATP